MLATLALAALLQPIPAQNGKLDLTNARNTYGVLGQKRDSNQLLPGDIFVVSFDIEGLKVKDNGEVEYSMGMELKNKEGKSQFKKEPQDLKAINALGGARLPAFAMTDVGLDTPPGEYTLTVTVTDRGPKTPVTATLERKFVVKKKELGIVALVLTDPNGSPMPPVAVPGQNLLINYMLVGFDVDKNKNPDLVFEMRIRDKAGKLTVEKPSVDAVKLPDPKTPNLMPNHYLVPINRSGEFTIELKATDKLSGKSVEEKLSITVLDVK
jgi:hypothetical protein